MIKEILTWRNNPSPRTPYRNKQAEVSDPNFSNTITSIESSYRSVILMNLSAIMDILKNTKFSTLPKYLWKRDPNITYQDLERIAENTQKKYAHAIAMNDACLLKLDGISRLLLKVLEGMKPSVAYAGKLQRFQSISVFHEIRRYIMVLETDIVTLRQMMYGDVICAEVCLELLERSQAFGRTGISVHAVLRELDIPDKIDKEALEENLVNTLVKRQFSEDLHIVGKNTRDTSLSARAHTSAFLTFVTTSRTRDTKLPAHVHEEHALPSKRINATLSSDDEKEIFATPSPPPPSFSNIALKTDSPSVEYQTTQ
ncbi:hypothetical protein SK128_006606, partial [Halocaridina rubra]